MAQSYYLNHPDQMLSVLNDLVSVGSITFSNEEKQLPLRVKSHLMNLSYFQENPNHIENHLTTDGRLFTTALYKNEQATKTIIMISHFDVVDIDDYGKLRHLAFRPLELTKELHNHKDHLPADALADLESGEWLFGRGTMDMKCGLVLQMSLLEKAAIEDWKINLLLLTVPDEEVNSVGMREAIPKLLEISKTYNLNYTLFLNSEPMFSKVPEDPQYYFYTGSIGKILPSVLCFGKETHVGEPLSGVNAAWMTSVFSEKMEWNEQLCEEVNGQLCPPPTILWQKDLKKDYSAQIPHRSVSMYNMFLMKRNPAEVMEEFKKIAYDAANRMNTFIENKYKTFEINSPVRYKIRVLTYEELKEHACKRTSIEHVERIENFVAKERKGDNRQQSITIVDQLSIICQDLAPMIVLFYAPPYYPAINTGDDPIIKDLSTKLITYADVTFELPLHPVDYFNGISDLSYAGLQDSLEMMDTYTKNLPGDEELYHIPFKEMAQLHAPVINVGPIGKDAHKNTERLHLPFAFQQLPKLLEHLIHVHSNQ